MTRAGLNFSRKTLAAGYERAKGKCQMCGLPLKGGRGHGDHILPAELGGKPTLANLQILCLSCHIEKTKDDIARIRKGDRQRDKASGAIRAEGRIASRGFAHKAKPERFGIDKGAMPTLKRKELFR